MPPDRACRQSQGSADQQTGQDRLHQADARARYERVVEVVDNLRAAGVDQLGLLTEADRRTKPSAARRQLSAKSAAAVSRSITIIKGATLWQWQLAAAGRSQSRYQRHAADRRAAGAADHLHGDHASHPTGSGSAGAAAASAEPAAAGSKPGPYRGHHHRQRQEHEDQHGADHD